jgi:hypothetical protein
MDDSWINRPYLESLTTRELVRMADGLGIDIPPGLERVFIIEEILEFASEDEDAGKPESPALVETDFLDTVSLPKQYNITFIEIMIRDPLWVFSFWEIKSHDKELHEKAPDFGGYYLKALPLGGVGFPKRGIAHREAPEAENLFTVPVGTADTAWYLGFPPSGGRYKVELCVLRGSEEIVLAVSRPFKLPKLLNLPGVEGNEAMDAIYKNPLIRLSGAEDFHVLRNVDRLSRIMRKYGS